MGVSPDTFGAGQNAVILIPINDKNPLPLLLFSKKPGANVFRLFTARLRTNYATEKGVSNGFLHFLKTRPGTRTRPEAPPNLFDFLLMPHTLSVWIYQSGTTA